jgi:hypothetical protein
MSKEKHRRIYYKMQMEMESKLLGRNCEGKSRSAREE